MKNTQVSDKFPVHQSFFVIRRSFRVRILCSDFDAAFRVHKHILRPDVSNLKFSDIEHFSCLNKCIQQKPKLILTKVSLIIVSSDLNFFLQQIWVSRELNLHKISWIITWATPLDPHIPLWWKLAPYGNSVALTFGIRL